MVFCKFDVIAEAGGQASKILKTKVKVYLKKQRKVLCGIFFSQFGIKIFKKMFLF